VDLSEFHFLRPQWLWALLPLALLLWRLARSSGGANAWRGLVDPHLLPHLLVPGGGSGPRRLLLLLGLGWLLLVLALAGPSWTRLPQPVYQAQQYRVLVLDISTAMNATDVPPSRLAHARFEVLDLLKRSGEGQIALIAYGAEPYVVSPLTADADTIALQVPSLSSELLPVPGQRAGPALSKANELLQQAGAPNGEVILISGGLEDPAAALKAARELRAAGHRLSVLALGTEQGAPVPDAGGGFLKDAGGAILMPKLDAAALRELSGTGGGRYVQSRADDRDLDALLESSHLERLEQQEDELAESDQWREEGPWLLLLLLPLAALAFRRGWLSPLLLVLFITPPQPASAFEWPATAFEWKDLWATPDQQGARALATEQPQQAAELFADPQWRAAAHYQAGDYQAALEDLEGQQGSEADYNRGNALAKSGQLEEAIQAYERTLEQNPEHSDARHNKELLEQLLQQQQEQQQQQSDQQQESGEGEQQQSDQQQQSGEGEQQQSDQQQQSGEREQQQSDQQQESGEGEQQQSDQQQQSGQGEQQQQQGEQDNDQPQEQPADSDQQQAEAEAGEQGEQQQEQEQQAQAAGEPQEPEDDSQEPGRSDLLDQQEIEPAQGQTASGTPEEGPIPESDQAMEQWLRRVPDDPAGLLRQRFLLQHLRNTGELPRQ